MIKFKSIKNDQIGYAWGWDSGSLNRSNISYNAHQFMTYNDGMVQHSPLRSLEPVNTIDYLYSLAEYLLQNPKEIEVVRIGWAYDESSQTIAFLASLHWKEGKTKYYCFSECKVSSADSKRYDKRWTEVPQYADGTLSGVYRLFLADHRLDFFHQIHLLNQIDGWFSERTGSSWSIYGKDNFSWLKNLALGNDEWDCWRVIHSAYSAVNRQVVAHYLTRHLGNEIQRYKEEGTKV